MGLIFRCRTTQGEGDPMIRASIERRHFIYKTVAAIAGWTLAGCASTGPTVTESDANKKRREIDTNFFAALERLFTSVHGSRELVAKARGILGFPTVIPATPGSGEQYGEGVLRVADAMEAYYNISFVSAGSSADKQSKTIIFLFMTEGALDKFRDSKGWPAGPNAPVSIMKTDRHGNMDSRTGTAPILAIGLGNSGLMTELAVAGMKIIPLEF
jgi:lipid-binding SYLF domain-containing protein